MHHILYSIYYTRHKQFIGAMFFFKMLWCIDIDTTLYFKWYVPLQEVTGKMFPVEIIYTQEPQKDYVEASIQTAVALHKSEPPGDILIFLTGEQEIEEACKKIADMVSQSGW